MRLLRLTVITLLSAVTMAGCGSSSSTETTTAPSAGSPQSSPSSLPSEVVSSIEADAGIPPKPDPATQAKFIAALNAIDTEIVSGKEDKAVDRARNQCSSVKEFPDEQAKLVDLTNQRFSSPGHPDGFGEAKAEKILKAVRTYICPTF